MYIYINIINYKNPYSVQSTIDEPVLPNLRNNTKISKFLLTICINIDTDMFRVRKADIRIASMSTKR